MQNELVDLAISKLNDTQTEINHIELAKLANFNDEEIEFVKLFWEPAFNKSWIYLTKSMVVDWMGYADSKDTMYNFYTKNLVKNYEENVDYKQVDKDDEIVKESHSYLKTNEKPGNRCMFFLITGECLKTLLMSAKTERGKQVRRFYIKTENLVVTMFEIVKKQQQIMYEEKLQEKIKELEYSKKETLTLKNEIKNNTMFKPNGYVYLATSKLYARNNIFRLGRTISLNKRMRKYQINRVDDDAFYYAFIYKTSEMEILEYILRNLLKKYRYDPDQNRDMYIVPSSILIPFVSNVCKSFNDNIIKDANTAIQNMSNYDFTEKEDPPEAFMQWFPGETEDVYDKLLEIINSYEGVKLLTEKENINTVFDNITIQCPHDLRKVQVRTILNNIGCKSCEKDAKRKEITNQLIKLENFDKYNAIKHMDENSEDFNILGKMDKKRIQNQNLIVEKLKQNNMIMLDRYQNCDTRFRYICQYGHIGQITWYCLKKLQGNPCNKCREINRTVKNIKVSSHSDDEEYKKMAETIGWKFIERTGKSGIIRWQCPNNHIVEKVKREFKRGYCKECNSI